MENNIAEPQELYLGYIIRKSLDPWAVKIHLPYEYFNPEGDGEIHGAGSVQECKDEIDERIGRAMERLNRNQKVI